MTVTELCKRFIAAPVQCMEVKGGLPCQKITIAKSGSDATVVLNPAVSRIGARAGIVQH